MFRVCLTSVVFLKFEVCKYLQVSKCFRDVEYWRKFMVFRSFWILWGCQNFYVFRFSSTALLSCFPKMHSLLKTFWRAFFSSLGGFDMLQVMFVLIIWRELGFWQIGTWFREKRWVFDEDEKFGYELFEFGRRFYKVIPHEDGRTVMYTASGSVENA